MGGFIGLRLLAAHPGARHQAGARRAWAKTICRTASPRPRRAPRLADALLTDDKASITDPRAKMFRAFADQPGKDRFALAACMRAMSPRLPPETLPQLQRPVLVVCGEQDDTAGAPGPWPRHFADGRAVIDCRPRPHVGGGRPQYPPGGDRFLPLKAETDPCVQSLSC